MFPQDGDGPRPEEISEVRSVGREGTAVRLRVCADRLGYLFNCSVDREFRS